MFVNHMIFENIISLGISVKHLQAPFQTTGMEIKHVLIFLSCAEMRPKCSFISFERIESQFYSQFPEWQDAVPCRFLFPGIPGPSQR